MKGPIMPRRGLRISLALSVERFLHRVANAARNLATEIAQLNGRVRHVRNRLQFPDGAPCPFDEEIVE